MLTDFGCFASVGGENGVAGCDVDGGKVENDENVFGKRTEANIYIYLLADNVDGCVV